jgi:hypothetical protein
MHYTSAAALLSTIGLLVSPVFSTICWGNGLSFQGQTFNVAYIQGSLSSSGGATPHLINPQGQNPCEEIFDLDTSGDHSGYQFAGCGGDSMWLNQNGEFHASCTYSPEKICDGPGCKGFDTFQQQYCC